MFIKPSFIILAFSLFSSSTFAAPAAPKSGDVVPGQYIVVLKPETTGDGFRNHEEKVKKLHNGKGPVVKQKFEFGSYKGYACSVEDATIEKLAAMPEVCNCCSNSSYRRYLVC